MGALQDPGPEDKASNSLRAQVWALGLQAWWASGEEGAQDGAREAAWGPAASLLLQDTQPVQCQGFFCFESDITKMVTQVIPDFVPPHTNN